MIFIKDQPFKRFCSDCMKRLCVIIIVTYFTGEGKMYCPKARVVSRSRSKRIKRIVINENLLIWTGLREPDGRTHKKSAKYPYRVYF
ncbi:MAG: hypothetical protein IJL88_06390, partial [Clostridia bacterium]|nr:hypothetical protein [Clostridia bacterium]